MRNARFILLAAAVLLSGCHHKNRAYKHPSPPTPVAAPPVGSMEEGIASWYGHPYHGRPAANGEIYDMEQMTAAHRTLPFETMVRVHDLDTGKSVDVRINDRGPFVDGRIIDLSHAAAREIDMIGPGVARVRVEILSSPAPAAPAHFAVQVGAFHNRDNAERLRLAMQTKYGTARLVERADTPGLWRVLVGLEPTQESAAALAQRLIGENGAAEHGFVVRVDSL